MIVNALLTQDEDQNDLFKGNCISDCKSLQNTKMCLILHILSKKISISMLVKVCKYTKMLQYQCMLIYAWSIAQQIIILLYFFLQLAYSLFICIAEQPTTTILQHIKIQSQIQQKIKAKINGKSKPTQQKSQNQQKSMEIKLEINPNISNGKPKPTRSHL